MSAADVLFLIARAAAGDAPVVDPNNLNLTTHDPALIKAQRKVCTLELKCPIEWATMHYLPNFAGNAVYLGCFAILLLGQLWFGFKHKTWKYMFCVCLGVIGEMVGYFGRLLYNKNPFPLRNFLMNLVPLTLAPALLTAGIYLCLGRVIVAVGAEHSRLKPKLYTIIFIGCDLLSLVLQAIGGYLASTADTKDESDKGVKVMIGGLVSQVVSMIIFFAVWGDFIIHVRKAKANGTLNATQPPLYAHLRNRPAFSWFQWSLFIATVLIFIRCVYRVAELWGGFDSHLANHELTFMIFEGPLIIGAVAGMTIFHPGRIFGDLWVPAGLGLRTSTSKEFEHDNDSTINLTEPEQWKSQTAYHRV